MCGSPAGEDIYIELLKEIDNFGYASGTSRATFLLLTIDGSET